MGTKKISELNEIYSLNNDDLVPTVDTTNSATKKMTIGNLRGSIMGVDTFSFSENYDIGDYCIYENTLYKCISPVTSGEDFDSTQWESTTIASEFRDVNYETIDSGTISSTQAHYSAINLRKYKKVIYNILAGSSAARDLRTSGIIEVDSINNSPINPSSNFQIYSTSSYYCNGVAYLSGSSNNAFVIQIKQMVGITNPAFEIIGILK